MYTIEDIKQLPLGTELIVKRRYGNGELILARSGIVVDSGVIYVYIDNGNGGEILTTVDLDEIIGIVQGDIIVDWVNCFSDQLVATGNEISITEPKPKYDCLRTDGSPIDCDCCEGYDSRVCPPVATQYKELRKGYNKEYDCLRADRIPKDCDCCEVYDSRVCPPVATQYRQIRKAYNKTIKNGLHYY